MNISLRDGVVLHTHIILLKTANMAIKDICLYFSLSVICLFNWCEMMTGPAVARALIETAKSISASIVRGSEVMYSTLFSLQKMEHAAII